MRQIRNAIAAADLLAAQKTTDEMIREEPKNFEGYYWRGLLELNAIMVTRLCGFSAARRRWTRILTY